MSLLLHGMHGLGDNFHQRAIIRHYISAGRKVSLVTPWPQVYYDLPVKCYLPNTPLRAQAKNVSVASDCESYSAAVGHTDSAKIWYTREGIQTTGGFLPAMRKYLGIYSRNNDFRYTVKPQWVAEARELIKSDGRPILFYRPLIERTEWDGCANRNPDAAAYAELFESIRDNFYVVSVADLKDKVEWISGKPIKADQEFHAGELSFEQMAGVMALSSVVYCSPGFALVMAQAIGKPVVCVFGGREHSGAYSVGARFTPTLGIDPINRCLCFNHLHKCDKTICMPTALKAVKEFVGKVVP